MVKLNNVRIPDFYDKLLDGYFFKEIVRTILDISGYMVFPYGFESAFSYIKIQLHKGEIKDSLTAKKIRSSPDLLVYDESKKEINLVEVKSRNWDCETDVDIEKLNWFKKYWEGSILAVIIPHGHWFYAQYIDDLEVKEHKGYNLKDEFKIFEDIFTRVQTDTLYRFKTNVAEKMGRQDAYYFLEKTKDFFFPSLLDLITKNEGMTIDQLFSILNQDNLVSKDIFAESLEELVVKGEIQRREDKIYLR